MEAVTYGGRGMAPNRFVDLFGRAERGLALLVRLPLASADAAEIGAAGSLTRRSLTRGGRPGCRFGGSRFGGGPREVDLHRPLDVPGEAVEQGAETRFACAERFDGSAVAAVEGREREGNDRARRAGRLDGGVVLPGAAFQLGAVTEAAAQFVLGEGVRGHTLDEEREAPEQQGPQRAALGVTASGGDVSRGGPAHREDVGRLPGLRSGSVGSESGRRGGARA